MRKKRPSPLEQTCAYLLDFSTVFICNMNILHLNEGHTVMGKKKEEKFATEQDEFDEMDMETESDPADLFSPDSQEELSAVIAALQHFCNDNILALKPLLDEVEDNEAVRDRIINFITISQILDSVEKLASLDLSEFAAMRKKAGKKKKSK